MSICPLFLDRRTQAWENWDWSSHPLVLAQVHLLKQNRVISLSSHLLSERPGPCQWPLGLPEAAKGESVKDTDVFLN